MEKKPYCTQNDGDCPSCSLVNYGLDCQNNPVDYAAFAASAMGKKGGSSTSPKKSASSAANLDRARAEGKTGGYPAGRKRGYFMNPATGSVDDYDGWWYETEGGEKVNAVDRGEVVRVVKDKDGNWIEK